MGRHPVRPGRLHRAPRPPPAPQGRVQSSAAKAATPGLFLFQSPIFRLVPARARGQAAS